MAFSRPTLPYTNQSLPNDNRYSNLSNVANPRPPTAAMLDADINYLIDKANQLETEIGNTSAGTLVGSNIALNAGLIPTTNGEEPPTISWIKIGAAQLEDRAITSIAIAVGGISSENLDDGVITQNKYAPLSIPTVAYQHLSIQTTAIDNVAITEPKLANESVSTRTYIDLSVTADKLANDSVPTRAVQALAITEPKNADNSNSTRTYIDSSVTEPKLADNSVSTRTIVAGALTQPKYGALSIPNSALQENSVTFSKIADGAVGTISIDDLACTMPKINGAFVSFQANGTIIQQSANIVSVAQGSVGNYTVIILNPENLPYMVLATIADGSTTFTTTLITNSTTFNILSFNTAAVATSRPIFCGVFFFS